MIEFEPSDIVVDEQRGELLVASNNEIVALPDGIPHNQEENDVDVKLLYRFPDGGEDLEALELIGDKIFAVSERNRSLISLFFNVNQTMVLWLQRRATAYQLQLLKGLLM